MHIKTKHSTHTHFHNISIIYNSGCWLCSTSPVTFSLPSHHSGLTNNPHLDTRTEKILVTKLGTTISRGLNVFFTQSAIFWSEVLKVGLWVKIHLSSWHLKNMRSPSPTFVVDHLGRRHPSICQGLFHLLRAQALSPSSLWSSSAPSNSSSPLVPPFSGVYYRSAPPPGTTQSFYQW